MKEPDFTKAEVQELHDILNQPSDDHVDVLAQAIRFGAKLILKKFLDQAK